MKNIGLLLILSVFLLSCENKDEKNARMRLVNAERALSAEDFSEAKLQLDSIKILHPKAFEARKAGIELLQQIEYKEQTKTLSFLDSLLQVNQQRFEEIKANYRLEKDPEYQDIGIYIYPTQTVEKNLNRSFLKAQVNEKGVMYLTSIYSGSSPIQHKGIKIIAPDGSFAETPYSHDIYEFKDLGITTEKVDYKLGQDGNTIGFIVLHEDQQLKVEYTGGKKYTITLTANDRKAISEVYTLAQVLSSIEDIKAAQKETQTKLEFTQRKIEESKEKNV